MNKVVIALTLTLSLLPAMSYGRFLDDERYRGWLWFESNKTGQDSAKTAENISSPKHNISDITPESAKAEIEQFARELEELKFVMLARPTPENVKAYRDKEKAMWTQAEAIHDAWDMANLLYPEQRDLINNPVNVHGIRAKRELASEAETKAIKELAQQFDLVLFFSSSCRYCQLLSPVLRTFGEQYGFNIEAISSNHTKHEYFKTADNASLLIEKLGITAFPTVIAISRDGQTAFELIRGYVSMSEIAEYALLAVKHLKHQGKWLE